MKLNGSAEWQFRRNKTASMPLLACFVVPVLIAAAPSMALSSSVCMPATEMEAALIDWYQEQPAEEIGHDIVLWTSKGGETWTLVKYRSDGVACTLENGINWRGFQSSASFDQHMSEDK
jgi:hypothetical protein